MAKFFIDRPVLAMVLSIVITLLGGLSIVALPIAQYPNVVPPVVNVSATYLGGSAVDVEKAVAQPLEAQLISLDNLIYISANMGNSGALTYQLTYEVGTNPDEATVQVQNKYQLASAQLPPQVLQQGVNIQKTNPSILLAIVLYSPDNVYDDLFLSNYVQINLNDFIATLPGVGQVRIAGQRSYGMRLWLDPDKLAKLGLTSTDIRQVVEQQNRQNPAGQIGGPPTRPGIDFQYQVLAQGRLSDADEFANIVVRGQADGSILRVKDVARVELGAQNYSSSSRFNGGPSSILLVYTSPGANALAVARAAKQFMEEAKKQFPPGLDYVINFDTTLFVRAAMEEVVYTLLEAIALVLLVVFIFLQNWRATLIPLLTVPVSVVGTFAAFVMFGFSINMTTLFGLVLAIGLVVDDAIVVTEAVQANIDTKGMTPRDAAIHAMDEVQGPVIAIALILSAVFLPVSFLSGITGQLYRNFALTIAVSVLISALAALTLSPALCALLLKPKRETRGPLGWFYRGFNWAFDRFTDGYLRSVRFLVRRNVPALLALALVGVGSYYLLRTLPTGFLPDEDQGVYFARVALPPGASFERTQAIMNELEDFLIKDPGSVGVINLAGFDLINNVNVQNVGTFIVTLTPWHERQTPELSLAAILGRARQRFNQVPGAIGFAVGLPPILGLSSQGGFEFQLLDLRDQGVDELARVADELAAATRQRPELAGVFSSFSVNTPALTLTFDREKARTLGIPETDVYDALQTYLGGLFVNFFNRFGRTWQVLLQAEGDFRRSPADIARFYVRARDGLMVPLSTLVSTKPTSAPDTIYRYNRYRTAKLIGGPAAGYSSGDAVAAMQEVADKNLPPGFSYQWTGTVYQQRQAEGKEPIAFGLSSVMVLLLLAALYESWATPFAVILAVPLGIFGALAGIFLRSYPYDVYTQIGIVTLIGLAAKNAILIVEFAKLRREEGMSIQDAAVEAARVRLRPILMTSFAFILGVLPLVIATGAGAGARRALGTAVFAGMISATVLAIFIVPTLYVVITRLAEGRKGRRAVPEAAGAAPAPAAPLPGGSAPASPPSSPRPIGGGQS
jgi:HAE1 family hydrophobic/amphiphilic exporter-1